MHKLLALSSTIGFLFLLTSITSIAYEDKKIHGDEEIRCKPDKNKTT